MQAIVQKQRHRLGTLLVQRKLISAQQLNAAVAEQRSRKRNGVKAVPALGEILVEMEFISSKQLSRCLKWQTFLRRATLTLAFTLAPLQLLHAAPQGEDLHGHVHVNAQGVDSQGEYGPGSNGSNPYAGSSYGDSSYGSANYDAEAELVNLLDHSPDYLNYGLSVPDVQMESDMPGVGPDGSFGGSLLTLESKQVDMEPSGLHYKADFSMKHVSVQVNYSF